MRKSFFGGRRFKKTHREMKYHPQLEHPPDGRGNEGRTRASWSTMPRGSVFVMLCDDVMFTMASVVYLRAVV